MSQINMESILSKARQCISSSKEKQKEISRCVDDYVLGCGKGSSKAIESAASKFIEVLQNEIKKHLAVNGNYADGGLGETAVSALLNLSHGDAHKIGENKYCITINFDDTHRESLVPEKYPGIDNIAALLNSGYEAGHTVSGVWKGHGDNDIRSLRKRSGAHFVENAIRDFMAAYGEEYGVIGIDVSEEFK